MPSEKRHYNLGTVHSEEMDDIIGHTPAFLVRYGMGCFFLVLFLIICASWAITYPDTVSGECTLYAGKTPKPVIPKANGRLSELFVTDGEFAKANQPLGLIENTADYSEVKKLAKMTSSFLQYVQQEQWNKISISPAEYKNIGELQGAFHAFYKSYIQLNGFILSGQYRQKKRLAKRELIDNDSLRQILQLQRRIYESDYAIADSEYAFKYTLYKNEVITLVELQQEESKRKLKKMSLESLYASLLSIHADASSKERKLLELDKQYFETKSSFILSLYQLVCDIELWNRKYLLRSPSDGLVSCAGIVQKNQELFAGQAVLYIEPNDNTCYAQIVVDQSNFGKIQAGQLAIIRLHSYPYQEYGSLQGQVAVVGRFPDKQKHYTVKVALPRGLLTDTGHRLKFTNELTADAHIITKKTRLLNKFFYSFSGLFFKDTLANSQKQR